MSSLFLSCTLAEFFMRPLPFPLPTPGLPSNSWEITPWGKGPKYLLNDHDRKFGRKFAAVARSSGIQELKFPIRSPKANAVYERIIGSLKRECLDHMLIMHRAQVRRLVKQYAAYYNLARPHQGIEQRIPEHFSLSQRPPANCSPPRIISKPVLGGLHHHYQFTPRLNWYP